MNKGLVVLKIFLSRQEAEYAKKRLADEGIEAAVSVDDVGDQRPHLAFTQGARVLVKKEDVKNAREILGL